MRVMSHRGVLQLGAALSLLVSCLAPPVIAGEEIPDREIYPLRYHECQADCVGSKGSQLDGD